MIYFVACPEANAVKIGITGNLPWEVFKRASMLQGACPLRLKIVGVQAGGRAEEKALHQRFSRYLIHGEWFRFVEELRDHCATLTIPEQPARPARSEKLVRRWADAA